MSYPVAAQPDCRLFLKPRRSRCKTGCLCCRLRKKKCDETKPTCGGCQKLHLICTWPASDEFAWRIRMGLSTGANEKGQDAASTRQGARTTRTRKPSATEVARARKPCAQSQLGLCTPPPFAALPLAGMYGSASQRLLQRYIELFSPLFIAAPSGYVNPWVDDVIPMAFSDSMIMNAVLTVGGTCIWTFDEATRAEERCALECYGKVVKQLKLKLTDWASRSLDDPVDNSVVVSVFLTTMLLCQHECFQGNKGGLLFRHLRASRLFSQFAYACKDGSSNRLLSVMLESYAFFELSSSIRLLPDQTDIHAMSNLSILQSQNLSQISGLGVLFGGATELFAMIPEICVLAANRKMELEQDVDLQCNEEFERLKYAITHWTDSALPQPQPKRPENDEADGDSASFARGKLAHQIIAQNAIFLFLLSSYSLDDTYLRDMSQPIVLRMLEVLPDLQRNPFSTSTTWPIIAIGSFAIQESHRTSIVQYLHGVLAAFPVHGRAVESLRWVWEGPENWFGLRGLEKAIEYHGSSYCFA